MSLFFLVFQVKLFIKLFYAAFPKCLEHAEVESLGSSWMQIMSGETFGKPLSVVLLTLSFTKLMCCLQPATVIP